LVDQSSRAQYKHGRLYLLLALGTVAAFLAFVLAFCADMQRREDQLVALVEARRAALAAKRLVRPVVGGLARNVDANDEINAALAQLRLEASEVEYLFSTDEERRSATLDVPRMLQRNAAALDGLMHAATASRLRGADVNSPSSSVLRNALELLVVRADAADGSNCLQLMLVRLRIASDGFALGADPSTIPLTRCVARAQPYEVARAATTARRIIADWPIDARREHDAQNFCSEQAARLQRSPLAWFDRPKFRLQRRAYVRHLSEICAPGRPPAWVFAGVQLSGGQDERFTDLLRVLHADVLVLEAVGGGPIRSDDAFADGVRVIRRDDGSAIVSTTVFDVPGMPVVVEYECARPGSVISATP